jgi:hypothetical protein
MPADLAAAFIAFNCTPGAWVGIPAAISLVYDGRNSTKTNHYLKKLRGIDPSIDERICGLSEELFDPAIEMLEETLQGDPRLQFVDDDPSGGTPRFYIKWLMQLCTEKGFIFAFVEDGIVRGVALVLPPGVPINKSSPVFFKEQQASKVGNTVHLALETTQQATNVAGNFMQAMSPRKTHELRSLRILCAKYGLSNEGPRKLLQARLEAAFNWNKTQLQEEMNKALLEEEEEHEQAEGAEPPPLAEESPAAKRASIIEGREAWELRHLRAICQKHGLSTDGSEEQLTGRISAGLGWGNERLKTEIGALAKEEMRGAFQTRKHLAISVQKRLDELGEGMFELYTDVAKNQDLRYNWRICLLGVRKSMCASGVDVGGALMQAIETAADNTGLPVYMEVARAEGEAEAEGFDFKLASSRQINFDTSSITAVKPKDRAAEILEEIAKKSSSGKAHATLASSLQQPAAESAVVTSGEGSAAADASSEVESSTRRPSLELPGEKQQQHAPGPAFFSAMVRAPKECAKQRCNDEMDDLFDFREGGKPESVSDARR